MRLFGFVAGDMCHAVTRRVFLQGAVSPSLLLEDDTRMLVAGGVVVSFVHPNEQDHDGHDCFSDVLPQHGGLCPETAPLPPSPCTRHPFHALLDCLIRSHIAVGHATTGGGFLAGGRKLRGRAFDLVERPSFERVAMAVIITYTLILMLHHLGEPRAVSMLIEISSTVFTVAFAVELLLKAAAYGFVRMLRRSPADVYDFAVVVVALIALFLDLLYGISFSALASTARVTRVLLVFKVMRGAQALQEVGSSACLSVRPSVGGCYSFHCLCVHSAPGWNKRRGGRGTERLRWKRVEGAYGMCLCLLR